MLRRYGKAALLTLSDKTLKSFSASVRANVRALWKGTFNADQFSDGMFTTISRGYEQAWQEGAKQCGILASDRSEAEQRELNKQIVSDVKHIDAFASYIERNSKANDGKLSKLQPRASIWSNRYNAVIALAQTTACADKKFKWNIGSTREHCTDCLHYNGRVYRASVWASVGAKPQSQSLECHGFNCQCFFTQSDERASGGRPKRPSGG